MCDIFYQSVCRIVHGLFEWRWQLYDDVPGYLLIGFKHVADIVCAAIPCGQGACKASNASILGFECECYPGWKKVQIGPFVFPPCVLPNCEHFLLTLSSI